MRKGLQVNRVGALVVCLVVVAACTGRPSADDAPPTSSVPAEAPQAVAGRGAIVAYEAMWRTFSVASQTADWRSPELARFASGTALSQLVENLQANEVRGIETRGTFVTRPTVTSSEPPDDPTIVRILDCGDDSGTIRVRADDGTPIEGSTGGRHRIEAEVRLVDGSWTVVDFRLRETGSC